MPPDEAPVNVAAEIAKLRGEMETGFARVDGRFAAGQQVMLSLDANMKRLEATVKETASQAQEALGSAVAAIGEWQDKAEQKCEVCQTGLSGRIGRLERWKWAWVGGLTVAVVIIEFVAKLVR